MNFDFRFILSRFLHRLHYFVAALLVCSTLGFVIAMFWPASYRAEAKLLVESPQIPTEMASSTVEVGANEALQIIEQRLQTRDNLIDLARRLNIYEGQRTLSPDRIVEDLRDRITIELPQKNAAASFVTISFRAETGAMSAAVTNELVSQILQLNVSLRTATAGQTLDFFKQEVARLDRELSRQGARIEEFKLKNINALPDSQDYRRDRQSQLQERLLLVERDLTGLTDRRAAVVNLYETTGQTGGQPAPRSPQEAELFKLRDELAQALTVYAPQNPKVTMLQARVASLEKQLAGQLGAAGAQGGPMNAYELQLADMDAQIQFAEEQKAAIENELLELRASLDATPTNAIALETLQRDFDNVQMQYNQAVERLAQAETGERIEALSKGQRIAVIEQAIVPDEPASPNRPLIAIGGLILGVLMGAALVALRELTIRTVIRPADLERHFEIVPLATIAHIPAEGEGELRHKLILATLAAIAVGVPVMLYVVHQYILPLDLLIARALGRA